MLKELQTILETMLNKNIILLGFFHHHLCRLGSRRAARKDPLRLRACCQVGHPLGRLRVPSREDHHVSGGPGGEQPVPHSARSRQLRRPILRHRTGLMDCIHTLLCMLMRCVPPVMMKWSAEHTPAVRILSMLATASYSGEFLL